MSRDELEGPDVGEFRHLVGVMWRFRILVALVLLIAVAAGTAVARRQPRLYEATAQLAVDTTPNALFVSGLSSSDPTVIPTQVAILSSGRSLATADAKLGPGPAWSLTAVKPLTGSELIEVTVSSKSAERAAAAANAYVRAYIDDRLAAQTAGGERRATVIQQQIDGLNLQLEKDGADVATAQTTYDAAVQKAALAKGVPPSRALLDAAQRKYNDLASTVADFQRQVAQYRANAALGDAGASLVVPALPPLAPASTSLAKIAGLAGLLGLIVGCGGALLLDALGVRSPRRRRRKNAHVELATGTPSTSTA